MKSIWKQKAKTPTCPNTPRLDGKCVLLTGGTSGIGLETSKGLAERGAEVLILARNSIKAEQVIEEITNNGGKAQLIIIDLADLSTISNGMLGLVDILGNQKIDVFIANAGIAPRKYTLTPQGYELAFATNVLGHHVFFKACLDRKLLQENLQVISITGDIYIHETNCTPNYKDGTRVSLYSRSKLGVMWWSYALREHHPHFKVNIVHPGVVATNLGLGNPGPFQRFFMRQFALTPKQGAQVPLICVTQPDVLNGGYYHNTMGRVILSENDPASNLARAQKFWDLLENLTSENYF